VVNQVRAAALTNYFEVARFVGLDPNEMLRRAKISPLTLSDPESFISGHAVDRLFEDSRAQSGCLHFGLLLAEARSVASLGPMSLLLSHQGTARDVVDTMIRYQMVFNEVVALSIEDAGDEAIIRLTLSGGFGRQSIEMVMGVICRTISAVVGGRWHPDFAHFTHPAPRDVSVHHRVFQCSLIFDSDFDGLVCSSASLDVPNPSGQSVMARHAQRYIEMLVPDAAGSLVERARRALYLLLPAERATLEHLGDNLGLHPRALQRTLVKEGKTFASLLNDVRRELALRYLSNPTQSISAIAQMVGYATPSSFTRWFCAEFGVAPAAWRAEERAEDRLFISQQSPSLPHQEGR
jgi:AraC-like DNA-binding protein